MATIIISTNYPVAFHIGPIAVHWYGLMYLMGFAGAWLLAWFRAKKPHSGWNAEAVNDLIFYAAVGVVLGGRIGYVLFYDFWDFLRQPWVLFQVWQGGMSFHGGLIGVIVATVGFSYRYRKKWMDVADFLAPLAPIGLGMGRLGNFINGELWGRVTDVPWGVIFTGAGPLPRHPTPIYEFLLEGVLLFIVLWVYSSRRRPRFAVSSLFLLSYGLIRFTVEFFREPDAQLGFIAWDWLTMGQLLSLPMIVVGIAGLIWAYRHKEP